MGGVTSMPPPWDPEEEESRETRILPAPEGETQVTRHLPPQPTERTRVVREPVRRERIVEEEAAPPPRRGGELWPWLLLLLGLVLAGIVAVLLFARDDDGVDPTATRPVPSVVRLPVDDARELLTEQGFAVEVLRRASDAAPRGIVFEQRPEAGTELREGGTVRITASVGAATTEVPDVVGSAEDDAVAALEDAGLEARVARVPSDEEEGIVVAQAPQAGADARRGSAVRVNVSGGPGAAPVPDVTGLPSEEAVAALREAGLSAEQREVDGDDPAGTVVAQEPEAGAEAERGSTVRIDVSRGPQGQAVPDVVGFAEEDARAELEGLGFRVRVVEEPAPDAASAGTVLRQVPPAGREAPANAQVTIVVGT
jgi:serine/threonine-protein kinase